MAHLSPYNSTGLVEEELDDLVASVSWLSSVAGKASPAPERVTEGHIEKVPKPHEAGVAGTRAFDHPGRTEVAYGGYLARRAY